MATGPSPLAYALGRIQQPTLKPPSAGRTLGQIKPATLNPGGAPTARRPPGGVPLISGGRYRSVAQALTNSGAPHPRPNGITPVRPGTPTRRW